jgi:hypothetical protein
VDPRVGLDYLEKSKFFILFVQPVARRYTDYAITESIHPLPTLTTDFQKILLNVVPLYQFTHAFQEISDKNSVCMGFLSPIRPSHPVHRKVPYFSALKLTDFSCNNISLKTFFADQ